jgi:hypothetical protein
VNKGGEGEGEEERLPPAPIAEGVPPPPPAALPEESDDVGVGKEVEEIVEVDVIEGVLEALATVLVWGGVGVDVVEEVAEGVPLLPELAVPTTPTPTLLGVPVEVGEKEGTKGEGVETEEDVPSPPANTILLPLGTPLLVTVLECSVVGVCVRVENADTVPPPTIDDPVGLVVVKGEEVCVKEELALPLPPEKGVGERDTVEEEELPPLPPAPIIGEGVAPPFPLAVALEERDGEEVVVVEGVVEDEGVVPPRPPPPLVVEGEALPPPPPPEDTVTL